jgi:transcriptional regulator with XRE-family HTH domain
MADYNEPMIEAPPGGEARVGDRLRAAREAAALSLQDIAGRTRIPIRLLEALERGDYDALPSITYCTGFTRAYARAVGLDEVQMVTQMRHELDQSGEGRADYYLPDDPADPARVPPRWLAWTTAVIALLLAGGYGIWRMQINTPPPQVETTAATPAPAARPAQGAAQPPPPPAGPGPVVLAATDTVWLRVYDEDRQTLLQKEMAKGETFTVPADARNPMILTGRPDALVVTVGGRPVPPLGTADRTVSDLPISAAALLARPAPSAPPPRPVAPAPAR